MKSILRYLIFVFLITIMFNNIEVNAASRSLNDGVYYIYSSINDKYAVDIYKGKVKNNNNIQLYNGNQTAAQQWKVTYLNNGYYKITSAKNDNYGLDVKNAKKKSGTNVQLFKYKSHKAQQWIIKDAGGGYYYIISKCNNLALSVKNGKAKNKSNIQVDKWNKSKKEKFIFAPVTYLRENSKIKTGKYAISSLLKDDYMVKLAKRKASNSMNIEMNAFHGVIDQYWYIQQLSNGYYKIATERDHNYVLDLKGGKKTKNTNIQLYKYTGSVNQQFLIKSNNDGSYTIISRANGLALDVAQGSIKNGTNLQTYYSNNTKSQKFNIISEEDTYSNSSQIKLNNIFTNANKVMIVAHPDDEALWGSHELYKDKYMVVCITCGPTRRDREYEFKRVMTLTEDDYMMLGFPDLVNGQKSDWSKDWSKINDQLKKIIEAKDWNLIVTHNPDGEYGHIHHKMTNKIITSKSNHEKLTYFGRFYWGSIPNKNNAYYLNNDEYNFKKNILLPVYESQENAKNTFKNMEHYETWVTYNEWYPPKNNNN